MDKIVYNNWVNGRESWLKEKDLIVGRVYVIKDGRLMLYLGKSTKGLYVFYVMASAYLEDHGYNAKTTFGNYDIQVRGLIDIINTSMNSPGLITCILEYKGIPKICGEFPFVNFEQKYIKWYTVSFSQMISDLGKESSKVPSLATMSNKPIVTGFVSSKDLIPGNLYYTGQCWRSTWVYLGRNLKGEYLWYFVGNEEMLVNTSPHMLLARCEKTKQNKKVKPLHLALQDKHAYVCSDTGKLIEMGFKVNMGLVDQKDIDCA